MNKIAAAAIQVLCDRSKDEMLIKVENKIKEIKEMVENIDLIVIPEYFYEIDIDKNNENNETEDISPWAKKISKKYNVNLVAGTCPVKMSTGKYRNRCLVSNRNGEIVAQYDKIHLFDAFGQKESDVYESGENLGIAELDIGKIGIWICYDTRFPEISRKLRMENVELFCVPAAFYSPNSEHWVNLLKSAAISNCTPVVAANQYGDLKNGRNLFGKSMIIDAYGTVNGMMSNCEGFILGIIDKEYTKKCRADNPEYENRKLNIYKKWYNSSIKYE